MTMHTGTLSAGIRLWQHYTVKQLLDNQGGMADIYLVSYEQYDYVAKILKQEHLTKPPFVSAIKREAAIHQKIQHANVVRVFHDFTQDQRFPGLLMEYVQGRNLNVTRGEGQDLAVVLQITIEIGTALQHVHELGFVHCDIKPGNILYNNVQQCYQLADFGIAQQRDTPPIERAGTRFYASPEIAKGEIVSAASDVYSFGITLYELIAGSKPFTDKYSPDEKERESATNVPSSKEMYQSSLLTDDDPVTLLSFKPDLPEIDGIIMKALDKAPDARYHTVAEFIQVLVPALQAKVDPQSRPQKYYESVVTSYPRVWLYKTYGEQVGERKNISGPSILIGRSQDCQIQVPDSSVSRRHAVIEWDRQRDRYFIQDRGSQLGTRVNSRYIEHPHYLHHNDLITIGYHNFRFEEENPHDEPIPAMPPGQDFLGIFFAAFSLSYLLSFFTLTWAQQPTTSLNGYALILQGTSYGNLLTNILAGFVVVMLIGLAAGLAIRIVRADMEEAATQGGIFTTFLALVGMRSRNILHDTGRLLLGLAILNVFLLTFLHFSLVDSTAAIGLGISHILSFLLVLITLPMYPPIAQRLGLENIIRVQSPYVSVEAGPLTGAKLRLDDKPFRIGRKPDNELVLTNGSVSRRHAQIEKQGGRYMIFETEKPSNPVYISNQKGRFSVGDRDHAYTLNPGDQIIIQDTVMKFILE